MTRETSHRAAGKAACRSRSRYVTGAVLLLLAGGAAAWGLSPAAAQPSQPAEGQQLGEYLAERSPQKVYRDTCGYCHGVNIGPIIRGRGLPADAVKAMVRTGYGPMPAFRPSEISPSELDALAAWIEVSEADPKEHGK